MKRSKIASFLIEVACLSTSSFEHVDVHMVVSASAQTLEDMDFSLIVDMLAASP